MFSVDFICSRDWGQILDSEESWGSAQGKSVVTIQEGIMG